MIITNYDVMSQQEKEGKSPPKKKFVTFEEDTSVHASQTMQSSSSSSSAAAPILAMVTQGTQTDDPDWSELMDKMRKKGKGVGRLSRDSHE